MRKSKNILENYKQNLFNYPKTLTRGVHNSSHWPCSETQKGDRAPHRTHEEQGKPGKLRKRRKSPQPARAQAWVWEVAQ